MDCPIHDRPCDLNAFWYDSAIDGLILELSFDALTYALPSSLIFNATTRASEVRLYGNPVGTVLRAPLDSESRLLALLPGAPPVLLFNLRLEGQLHVQNSSLYMEDCDVTGSRSESDGGAVLLTGGRFEARGSAFFDNRAASNGGAVCIDGGDALFDWCRFEGNRAEGEGGGLFVRRGSVVLRNGTYFQSNFAAYQGHSISAEATGSNVLYRLPAPPGHFINAAEGTSQQMVRVMDMSFPFACPP